MNLSGTATSATDILETAFTGVANEVTGTVFVALPIAMGVIALVIGIRFGIRWFRSILR